MWVGGRGLEVRKGEGVRLEQRDGPRETEVRRSDWELGVSFRHWDLGGAISAYVIVMSPR